MKNLKFRVHSPEHSEAIQKRLFELGCEWSTVGKEVINKEENYLFCISKKIVYSNNAEKFKSHQNQLATLDDIYKDDREQLTIKEVEERFNVKVIK